VYLLVDILNHTRPVRKEFPAFMERRFSVEPLGRPARRS